MMKKTNPQPPKGGKRDSEVSKKKSRKAEKAPAEILLAAGKDDNKVTKAKSEDTPKPAKASNPREFEAKR
ncbi:hypothetical protein NQ317_007382 [Molorchus minor]|uniref:Uncharacterized protein n=1 Tax=Molorchus minor TaxID=1323400 RepID=A0ABQ9IRH1_9CUCU|nr:hypothetical protein NQ317_007382 [Molorchus minor]